MGSLFINCAGKSCQACVYEEHTLGTAIDDQLKTSSKVVLSLR